MKKNFGKRIIMDVDPGIDDSLAILLALRSPEIKIEGITTVSGNVEVNQATRNALKAVSMADAERVPVYKGMTRPLIKKYVDAADTHGRDGLGERFYPEVDLKPEKEHAVDFMTKTILENPEEITILALGPLTNIATLFQKNSEVAKKVKNIVLMGGSAAFHGNCSPVAEYNFWVDPDAAKIVLNSGVKVVMVGLDVTHYIILTPNLREVLKQLNTPISKFIYEITDFYVNFHWKQERTIGCVINDPLATAILIDPSIVETEDAWVDVETQGITIGQSVVDFGGVWTKGMCNTEVCMKVNPKKFFEIFLHRMVPEYPEDIQLAIDKQYWGKEEMLS